MPPVLCARTLENEALPHQLTKDAAQALFGDAQYAEQFADSHLRMASDEVDDAMMGTPKTVLRENRIGFCGEIAIRKEQELDPLAQLVLTQERWVGG